MLSLPSKSKHFVNAVIFFVLLLTQTVEGSECMNPPVTRELVLERLCDVSAAFTAHVVSYDENIRGPDQRRILNTEVTEVFKGKTSQLSRVLSAGYSGPHLNPGDEVLIFAYTVPNKDYVEVRHCSVSGPLSKTSVYLEPIRMATSDLDQNCSRSTRDARAEILREQSDENMQRIMEEESRGLSELNELKKESQAPDKRDR